eukprot:g8830.t1
MTDKLDMSLDDIIEQSKKHTGPRGSSFRPRGGIRKPRGRDGQFSRRGGRNTFGAGKNIREPLLDSQGRWRKDTTIRRRGAVSNPRPSSFRTTTVPVQQQQQSARYRAPLANPPIQKLFLSNLGYRVSQNDIVELFSQIGPLKSARVNYDRSGRSLGTGEVTYEVPAHAAVAERRFNGILIDSQPLVVEKSGPSNTTASTKLSSGITVMDPRESTNEVRNRVQDFDRGLHQQGSIQPEMRSVHQTLKSAVVASLTPDRSLSGNRVRSSIMRSGLYSDHMDIA